MSDISQGSRPKSNVAKMIAAVVVVIVILSSAYIFFNNLNTQTKSPSSITVTDDLGRQVTVKLPVKRIVSMDPSNTQMIYSIGAGPLLVADTSYDWWPANATKLPKVEMANGTASVEEVVAMKPDLVVATTIQPVSIVDQLTNLSIPVIVFEPTNITGIYHDMKILGEVTGQASGALNEVNHMKSFISNITSRVSKYQTEKILYMLWSNPVYTVGPGSFINSIIQTANGFNIASNLSSPYPIISNESVIAADPQAIIVDNGTGIQNVSYFKSNPEWNNISAVQNSKILFLNVTESNYMNEPGPLTIYGIQVIAEFLYPQAF